MSEALQVFEFNGRSVRSVMVENEPWFIAIDACRILALENLSLAMSRIDTDDKRQFDKGVCTAYNLSIESGYSLYLVSEAGLYDLIFQSRTTEARPFKRWVTHEVLPAIRRTGSYSLAPKLPHDYVSALKALVASEEEKLVLAAQNAEKDRLLIEAQPKVEGFDTFLSEANAVSLTDLAKTLGYKAREFKAHMIAIGVLMKNGKPYALYANRHWFRLIQVQVGPEGRKWFTQKVMVETVGQEGIYQLLKRKPLDIEAQLPFQEGREVGH